MGPIPIAQVNLPSCSLVEYSHSGLTTVYDKPFRVFQGSIVWIVWEKKGTARSPSKSVGLVSWPHRVWARTCELAGSNRCQCMPCNFDSLCTHACVAAWVWFILILCVCVGVTENCVNSRKFELVYYDSSMAKLRCLNKALFLVLVVLPCVWQKITHERPASFWVRDQRNKYGIKTKKNGIPCSLWPLQQFGDKTEHFCGICIVLEVEPLTRKGFAGHWT